MRKHDHPPFPANINFVAPKIDTNKLINIPNSLLQTGLRCIYVDDTCFDYNVINQSRTFHQNTIYFSRLQYAQPRLVHRYPSCPRHNYAQPMQAHQFDVQNYTLQRLVHPQYPQKRYYAYTPRPPSQEHFRTPINPGMEPNMQYLSRPTIPDNISHVSEPTMRPRYSFSIPPKAMSHSYPGHQETTYDPTHAVLDALCTSENSPQLSDFPPVMDDSVGLPNPPIESLCNYKGDSQEGDDRNY